MPQVPVAGSIQSQTPEIMFRAPCVQRLHVTPFEITHAVRLMVSAVDKRAEADLL